MVDNAAVFRGYYSGKKQFTEMKDYKSNKKGRNNVVSDYN